MKRSLFTKNIFRNFLAILMLLVLILVSSCTGEPSENENDLSTEDMNGHRNEKEPEDENSGDDKKNSGMTEGEETGADEEEEQQDSVNGEEYGSSKDEILEKHQDKEPTVWGENIPGVVTRITTSDKVIALTFDACGGTPGQAYDEDLIRFLRREGIPATLFFTGGWIKNHPDIFKELAEDPLFEAANHGYRHKPLSVRGESAYGIQGTGTLEEAYDEVMKNQELMESITGEKPVYFRSGTAYYDDVAVGMLKDLGLLPVNYNVLGDAGATFTEAQIVSSMESAEPGSIILFHMNHPDKPIANGVEEGVNRLKARGFSFVTLGQYHEDLQ